MARLSRYGGMAAAVLAPRLIAIAVGALLLAGCAANTIEEAVPKGAVPASAEPADTGAQATGPTDTGRYPNLNIKRVGATTQLTPQQAKSETARLKAINAEQNAAPAAPASSAGPGDLKKLGQDSAASTLKAIAATR